MAYNDTARLIARIIILLLIGFFIYLTIKYHSSKNIGKIDKAMGLIGGILLIILGSLSLILFIFFAFISPSFNLFILFIILSIFAFSFIYLGILMIFMSVRKLRKKTI